MAQELWVERYRPKTVEDYVFSDTKQRRQVEQWISEKSIPHLLLSGTQGLGKSSLINVLLHEIGLESGDILNINASEQTGIDTVRDKIMGFAATIPYGDFKVLILEEAEAMSASAQQSLKRIIEENSETCRFILTSNAPHKIIPPLHSRLQNFHMTNLDKEQFRDRVLSILINEQIFADLDNNDATKCVEIVGHYIDATYPDLRKCINSIQLNIVDGKLTTPSADSGIQGEWMIKMVELFKKGQISEARTYVCTNADYNDYPEIYRYLYRNLQLWGESEAQREEAIICIRDGLVKDGMVGDREINLSATLVQLKNIRAMSQK